MVILKTPVRLTIIIILLTAFFIFGPLASSHAASNNAEYFVSKYIVNINIETDGSAVFEERITCFFKGSFDGFVRDIDISGSDGIQEQEVFIDRNGNFEQISPEESGNAGTYSFQAENNTAKFKIHEPVKDDIKTFVFKYRLNNVVTRYSDIAEFKRKIIDSSWNIPINDVTAVITVPKGTSVDNLKIFIHGTLAGESRVIDDRNIELTVPVVSPGDYVEARVLFPPELVPYSTKVVSVEALPRILDVEKRLAEEANIKREEARRFVKEQEEKKLRLESEKGLKIKKLQPIGLIITLAMLLAWFYILFNIYFKHDIKYKHNFKSKYLSKPPGDYTPAEMSILVWGTIHPRDLMATFLDIIRKKFIIISSNIDNNANSQDFTADEKTDNYKISRNKQILNEHIKAHESFLIELLLDKIGNGESVTTNEIFEYIKKRKNSSQFKSDYNKWISLVEQEAACLNFYEKSRKHGKHIGLIFGVVYLLVGILLSATLRLFSPMLLTISGIILLVYSSLLKEYSLYGNEQYAMWLAFKRFLKEFSSLEKDEGISLAKWEQYIPYAVSLGVAKDVIRQFSGIYSELDFYDKKLTYLFGGKDSFLMLILSSFNNTMNAVENIIDSKTNEENLFVL